MGLSEARAAKYAAGDKFKFPGSVYYWKLASHGNGGWGCVSDQGWDGFLSYHDLEQMVRIEDAPSVASLSGSAQERKNAPMFEGLLAYFPNALAAVAQVSKVGNDQHNPGQPMHWAYNKSSDEADCIIRHLAEKGTTDKDGLRHSAKVAWRALALLERELLSSNSELKPGVNVRDFKR